MAEERYEGISRNKIPWDPIIDYEKCVTCGKCIDYCHVGAFKLDKKNNEEKTVVIPNLCIVFCCGCEDICPSGAIKHPSKKETKKAIEKLKKNQRRKL